MVIKIIRILKLQQNNLTCDFYTLNNFKICFKYFKKNVLQLFTDTNCTFNLILQTQYQTNYILALKLIFTVAVPSLRYFMLAVLPVLNYYSYFGSNPCFVVQSRY